VPVAGWIGSAAVIAISFLLWTVIARRIRVPATG
jgi:hypothetical protein